jgi:DMSO/TMAO reductase YedYZ molybdopterin-dependent catalytic subunit
MLFTEMARPGFAFPGEEAKEELVSFLDMPPAKPNMLDWETLDSWITPQDQVFSVSHYNEPDVEAAKFRLEITGLVDKAKAFTLDELKALPAEERLMTLECSGNGSAKGFTRPITAMDRRWRPFSKRREEAVQGDCLRRR